jgi:hypothetical protein
MKTKIKTPEGIAKVGRIDDEQFEAVRLVQGGGDFSVQFRVDPNRKLQKAIWGIQTIVGAEVDKPQAREIYTALSQLALPLNPRSFVEYSVKSGIVPIGMPQRGGSFHKEDYPTTTTSNIVGLTTEYLVDDRPRDKRHAFRTLSEYDLLHGYDLTTTDLDGMPREEIERLGLTVWSPDASEIIQSQNAVHRSVVNETGEAQERVFARATQL